MIYHFAHIAEWYAQTQIRERAYYASTGAFLDLCYKYAFYQSRSEDIE